MRHDLGYSEIPRTKQKKSKLDKAVVSGFGAAADKELSRADKRRETNIAISALIRTLTRKSLVLYR